MELLVSGLLLWSVIHFIPSIATAFKVSFIERFGDKLYMAIFALLIVLSLVMIVFGWRSITPTHLYELPSIIKPFSLILLVVAFFLFGATKGQTRIKRVIRHPQLASVIVWSIAHLLLNGDSRSVLLFGWLGCWAVLEMVFINKREGEWEKPEIPSWKQEIKTGLVGLAIFAVVILIHPYIAGVPVG